MFQIGTVALSRAAHLLRGNDTYCSVTSKLKRIWVFFLACSLLLGFLTVGVVVFCLLSYVFIIWDFIYGTVFLSMLQQIISSFLQRSRVLWPGAELPGCLPARGGEVSEGVTRAELEMVY